MDEVKPEKSSISESPAIMAVTQVGLSNRSVPASLKVETSMSGSRKVTSRA